MHTACKRQRDWHTTSALCPWNLTGDGRIQVLYALQEQSREKPLDAQYQVKVCSGRPQDRSLHEG